MYDRNLRDRQEKAMVDYIIQMVIALSIFKSDYSYQDEIIQLLGAMFPLLLMIFEL